MDLITNEKVTIAPVGVTFSSTITDEELEDFLAQLGGISRFSAWAIGDTLVFAENRNNTFSHLLNVTGLSLGRLNNLMSTCRNVPIGNRVEGLSISHHTTASKIKDLEMQRQWLIEAYESGWTRDEFRQLLAGEPEEKETVLSLRELAQCLVTAWRQGEELELWLEKLAVMVN